MRTDKEILLDLINLVEEHNANCVKRESMSNNRIFGIESSSIDLFNKSVVHEDQLDILQEECAELIQACSKFKRNKTNGFDSLKEEMAHVLISSAMIAKILGITQEDIDLEVDKKRVKFISLDFFGEPKVDRDSLFRKYKERARKAYNIKENQEKISTSKNKNTSVVVYDGPYSAEAYLLYNSLKNDIDKNIELPGGTSKMRLFDVYMIKEPNNDKFKIINYKVIARGEML